MRKITRKDVEHYHSNRTQAFIMKAFKEALPTIFRTGHESVKGGMNNSLNVFVEHVLKEMAHSNT